MAQEDLAFAKIGLKEDFFSQVCFLSQQVVEKSLKAFLLSKGRPYPRIHKVVELASLCKEIQVELSPLKDSLKMLDEFYIPTRYPDALPGNLPSGMPSQREARDALEVAEMVLALIRDKI